jgi:hypothetical protein
MYHLATPVFFVGQSRGDCWLQAGYFRIYRKWCDFSGARWSGAASGARPRHVRVRMVSRFSALQTKGRAKILQWRQMRAFSNFVSEWCGDVVTARAYRVAGRGDRVRYACGGTWSPPGSRVDRARFTREGAARFTVRFSRAGGAATASGTRLPRAVTKRLPRDHSWVPHRSCADAS